MDYVDGPSLADVLREGPLPPRDAAALVRTVALALQYSHQSGILHRDLKPSNILFDPNHGPQITDFGLAKRRDDDGELTATGELLGSPNYLSPEQAAGRHREVDVRNDVYSLGAVLYETLTGRPPFWSANLAETQRHTISVWPRTHSDVPAPAWLPDLAEAIAGRRLDDQRRVEAADARILERMRPALLRMDPLRGDDFDGWAHWFLDTERRGEPVRPVADPRAAPSGLPS